MTMQEIMRLTRKSRRGVMRMVEDHDLPPPVEFWPMSWDEPAIVKAWKRYQAEGKNGRQTLPRDGRTKRARTARLARTRIQAGREA